MELRPLGQTGLKLSQLSFGASSLGQEFRSVDLNEALRSVRTALDLGMNFIDTSPYYGRGMSEVLLGVALRDVPRDKYLLGTKLGRYDGAHFDFSARRVVESVDISLHRMGVDYLDIMLCHDIEFVDMRQIIDETLPALRKVQQQGKVRFIGISGYPMNIFRYVLDQQPLDVVLSYNHYTLQNTMLADLLPYLQSKGVGVMNAAPFSARLLTRQPLPPWHKATPEVRAIAKQAADHCSSRGVDIAQLAVQFSIAHPGMTTCIVGSANPENVKKWVEWAGLPIDQQLLSEVQQILKPIHNWFYTEGRAENNDQIEVRTQK
ncbi:D-threo-aldose 1-dehydrogenase [Anatilimnocola aggregata]|uniref:D-threo-aldose 1-dehydrogenase n=1 Tax=Anatilimnocola aggregata TaxID=2528021 RepID=A0A517YLZ3_9BACT|nr:aldo/keto reductase [Anatilimnocola aggregata]QDU31242.1 D-threo-aldose 1-dehydrogenase [Anatilimnocola aggregata]